MKSSTPWKLALAWALPFVGAAPACFLEGAGTKVSGAGGAGDHGAAATGGGSAAGADGGAAGGGQGGASACSEGRTTADRPDDAAGYQVRVDYVLPSDGVDEHLDTDGRLATSIAALTSWFQAQAGGRSLRLDTCGGKLDVRFVQLADSDASLADRGVFIRDALEAAMDAAGLLDPQKIEAVYYGGSAREVCGNGPAPPELVGRVAAVYLKGTFADPSVAPCSTLPVGASAIEPGLLDFTMMHEILHALGAAPPCGTHTSSPPHTSDSPSDLMYAGPEIWRPSQLDVGRDDYFDHGIAGCPDVAKSAFIEPLPDDAAPPPGW